jgi:hypothetical protein
LDLTFFLKKDPDKQYCWQTNGLDLPTQQEVLENAGAQRALQAAFDKILRYDVVGIACRKGAPSTCSGCDSAGLDLKDGPKHHGAGVPSGAVLQP